MIDIIRRRLSGQPINDAAWKIIRSLPHGHVAAVLGTLREIGLDRLLASRPSRLRDVVVAMIVARVAAAKSKLVTARRLQNETADSSLGLELGVGDVAQTELYDALDWLGARQMRIENKLAKRHLEDGMLVLNDISGSYYTGQRGGLVQFGYNRDGKKGVPPRESIGSPRCRPTASRSWPRRKRFSRRPTRAGGRPV